MHIINNLYSKQVFVMQVNHFMENADPYNKSWWLSADVHPDLVRVNTRDNLFIGYPHYLESGV